MGNVFVERGMQLVRRMAEALILKVARVDGPTSYLKSYDD